MLLAMTCGMQAYAQAIEDGEAFYIYRNDGDFNGFFYDEVLDMRYSKIGLDSVEYDSYVVQEVETADSIYRIPLCAIDSIGFVQPPIVLNPDIKYMDDLGMNEYLFRADELEPGKYYMALDGDKIPRDLIPKVGDVIINSSSEMVNSRKGFWYGFSFKVTEVVDKGWLIQVYGEDLQSIGDVFRNFITTERIMAGEDGKVRRRLAGMKSITRAAADASFNLLNLSGTLVREYKEGNNGSLSISLDYGVKVGISVSYDITVDHLFVKLGLTEDLSAQAGFSGTLQGTWEPPLKILPDWLTAIKFPACLPLFETNALPEAFFRIQGTIGIKSTLPSVNFKGHQLFIISDRTGNWINTKATSNFFSGYGENGNLFQPGDSRLTLSGSVQAGVKFDNKIKTNGWARKIFQSAIGLQTYVGPKLTGAIDVSIPKLLEGEFDYGMLSSMYILFNPCSADMEASASVNFLTFPEQSVKFAEGSYSIFKDEKRYLVPQLRMKAEWPEPKKPKLVLDIRESVLLPDYVSIVIYKRDGDQAEVCRSKAFYHSKGDQTVEYSPSLPPGAYLATVVLDIMGKEVKASASYIDVPFDIMPKLELSDTKVDIPCYGEEPTAKIVKVIKYTTDYPAIVSIKKTEGSLFERERATCELDTVAKTITITTRPNHHLCYYNGKITVEWRIGKVTFGNGIPMTEIDLHQDMNIPTSLSFESNGIAHRTKHTYRKYTSDGHVEDTENIDADDVISFNLPGRLPVSTTHLAADTYVIKGSVSNMAHDNLGNVNIDFKMFVTVGEGDAWISTCEWNLDYNYDKEWETDVVYRDKREHAKGHGRMSFATDPSIYDGQMINFGASNSFYFMFDKCNKFESDFEEEHEWISRHGWDDNGNPIFQTDTYQKTTEKVRDFRENGRATLYLFGKNL